MPGCYGRGNRYRHWYYATGIPGWMRSMQLESRADVTLPGGIAFEASWQPRDPELSRDDELQMLEEECQIIEDRLADVKKRMKELQEVK